MDCGQQQLKHKLIDLLRLVALWAGDTHADVVIQIARGRSAMLDVEAYFFRAGRSLAGDAPELHCGHRSDTYFSTTDKPNSRPDGAAVLDDSETKLTCKIEPGTCPFTSSRLKIGCHSSSQSSTPQLTLSRCECVAISKCRFGQSKILITLKRKTNLLRLPHLGAVVTWLSTRRLKTHVVTHNEVSWTQGSSGRMWL